MESSYRTRSNSLHYNDVFALFIRINEKKDLENTAAEIAQTLIQSCSLAQLQRMQKEGLSAFNTAPANNFLGNMFVHTMVQTIIGEVAKVVGQKTDNEMHVFANFLINGEPEKAFNFAKSMDSNNPNKVKALTTLAKVYLITEHKKASEVIMEIEDKATKELLLSYFIDIDTFPKEFATIAIKMQLSIETMELKPGMQAIAGELHQFSIEELETLKEQGKACKTSHPAPAANGETYESITNTLINSVIAQKMKPIHFKNVNTHLANENVKEAFEEAQKMPKKDPLTQQAFSKIALFYIAKDDIASALQTVNHIVDGDIKVKIFGEILKSGLSGIEPSISNVVDEAMDTEKRRFDRLSQQSLEALEKAQKESEARLNILREKFNRALQSGNESWIKSAFDEKSEELKEQMMLQNIIERKKAEHRNADIETSSNKQEVKEEKSQPQRKQDKDKCVIS